MPTVLEILNAQGLVAHSVTYDSELMAKRASRVLISQISGKSRKLLIIGEQPGDGYYIDCAHVETVRLRSVAAIAAPDDDSSTQPAYADSRSRAAGDI